MTHVKAEMKKQKKEDMQENLIRVNFSSWKRMKPESPSISSG
jgi:hypothetical protein